MGLFDKLGNKTINELIGDTKEGLKGASRKVKESLDDASRQMKDQGDKRKMLKAPVEGAIERYAVIYNGGLPHYPKKMSGEIGLNILEDSFYFKATSTSEEWFDDMAIPYKKIEDLQIVKRKVTNAEVLLSSSGSDMKSLEQENTIEITFMDAADKRQIVRFEMLTGITVYAQAGKCIEFVDILRQNGILNLFPKPETEDNSSNDILTQIEKLSQLKEKGLLSNEEFDQNKAKLLEKM